jgi:hypothetical protein
MLAPVGAGSEARATLPGGSSRSTWPELVKKEFGTCLQ